jgi:hypothetical protein
MVELTADKLQNAVVRARRNRIARAGDRADRENSPKISNERKSRLAFRFGTIKRFF